MTTFKNNIILWAHLEHSESWQFEDAPVAKRSGWVSAKRELRSSRKAPRPRAKGKLF